MTQKTKAIILWLINMLILGLASLFGYICFVRLQLQYNSEGNYFEASNSIVYNESAILTYGAISFLLLMIGIITSIYTLKLKLKFRNNKDY